MPIVIPDQSFVSAKTSAPVPCHGDLARLALIRATLDSSIATIAPLRTGSHDGPAGVRAVATLVGVDGSVALCVRSEGGPDASDCAMPALVYSAAELMRDPLAANLRAVWSCARRWVSPGDQVRVLHVLDENGTTSLIDAAQAATASVDGVATVLAMACRGLIEIDLDDAPPWPRHPRQASRRLGVRDDPTPSPIPIPREAEPHRPPRREAPHVRTRPVHRHLRQAVAL